ncbi:hypothetical protein KAW18_10685 [candidate division WOR-3 bacterium]|nr:hypothetical protein [candidate division WOR-3 bacterium]
MTDGGGRRAEGRGRKTEDGGRRTEDGRQRTEGRGRKSRRSEDKKMRRLENGGQKSEDAPVEFPWGNPIQLGKEDRGWSWVIRFVVSRI